MRVQMHLELKDAGAESTTSRAEREPSRRSFLMRSATTAAIPGLVLATSSAVHAAGKGKTPAAPKPKPTPSPTPVGRLPDLYPGWLRNNFRELMNDEAQHVQLIRDKLNMDPDNPFLNDPRYTFVENGVKFVGVRPVPHFANLLQPTLAAFASTAAAIENTGVGVYLDIIEALTPDALGGEYFETATEVATIEARHTGFLNTVLNMAVVPGGVSIDSTVDQQTALGRIAGFIPGGADNALHPPVMSYSRFNPGAPSKANDFFVLDYLLLLEYLEAMFYRLNFTAFFGA